MNFHFRSYRAGAAVATLALVVSGFAADEKPRPLGLQEDGPFKKVILDQNPELQAAGLKYPMDLELGPDGCLYLAETGTAWSDNRDMQISRIEHHGE